ncbi:hypothetical protein MTO96_045986 [Rhipicephalus appendiculatus]
MRNRVSAEKTTSARPSAPSVGGASSHCRQDPASNASKCPTSSAAGGGSGNAPQKHLRRRWRRAYGPPAKVMIRVSRGRPRGGAPPRRPAAGAGPVDVPAPVGALALAGALARESGPTRPRGLPRVKQKPPKVRKGSPPEQSNPRIEQLEQENRQLRAALEQLRAQFESFRKSHSSTPAPSELPAEASAPIWSTKKRALVAPVEGERDLEEFKNAIMNSMKDVRESVNSLQGAVITLVQTVTALTNRVDTIETRVGLGDSNSGFPGAVRSGLPYEEEGFRRGSPYERPSKSSKHGGSG